jgi:hypothetical protein
MFVRFSPKLWSISRAAFAAFAVFMTASAAGMAAAPLFIGPQDRGAAVTYHIAFDGHFWNGEKRAFENDISFVRSGDRTLDATVTSAGAPSRSFAATLADGGTLVAPDGADHVIGFNTIAALVAHAPADLHPGARWNAEIATPSGASGSVLVPFDVRVASVDGTRTVVEATAGFATSSTYSGFDVPLDYDIRVSAAFDAGRFSRADYAASEVIHAGPQTQTMTWTWSLADAGR